MRRGLTRCAILVAGLLAGLSGAISLAQDAPELPRVEQVPLTIAIEHYDVEGRRYRDAVSRIRQVGPMGYDAVTHSAISYYFETSRGPDGCSLRYLELPLDVRILYPRWTGYERARRAERDAWDRHIHVLTVHENIHALIAFLGTIEAYNSLIQTAAEPDCDALQALLRARTDEANDRVRQWQRDFDRVTDHGMEQDGFDLQAFMAERL